MPKPTADHVDINTRFNQVDGACVTEDMRTYLFLGGKVIELCRMPPHDLVDAGSGEGLSSRGCENRALCHGLLVEGRNQGAQQFSGLTPEWASPPLVALAVKTDTWMLAQIKMPNPQIGHLLYTRSSVVQE